VDKAKQNVILVIEEELLLAARKIALEQRRSVARARLRKAFETGLVEVGERKWSRGDLYEIPGVRISNPFTA